MSRTSKKKNPLYVVKGKDVQEASSLVDLAIKKLNLTPVIQLLKKVFSLMLEQLSQIESYPMLVALKNILDQWIQSLQQLMKKFSLA